MKKRVRKNGYLLINNNGRYTVESSDCFYEGLVTGVYRTKKEMVKHLMKRLKTIKKEIKKCRMGWYLKDLKKQQEAYKYFIYTLITNR